MFDINCTLSPQREASQTSGHDAPAGLVFSAPKADLDLLHSIAQHDDKAAFEVLFKRYYRMLCHFAMRLLDCSHTAEEVASDVLVRIWQQRKQIQIQSSLKAYLLIAVRNSCIDRRRRGAKRRFLPLEQCIDAVDQGNSALERLTNEETVRQIECAIESLPKQGRIIFRLSREQGMKYREIAAHLGLSVKTIETHMLRSLQHLRRCISEGAERALAGMASS
ncbi:MAG: RNA polymerase sigma-70 factor [Saprospiraceae bacterium]